MTPIKIFISTGEVSGDLQGALLVEALYRQAQLRGLNLNIVALGAIAWLLLVLLCWKIRLKLVL